MFPCLWIYMHIHALSCPQGSEVNFGDHSSGAIFSYLFMKLSHNSVSSLPFLQPNPPIYCSLLPFKFIPYVLRQDVSLRTTTHWFSLLSCQRTPGILLSPPPLHCDCQCTPPKCPGFTWVLGIQLRPLYYTTGTSVSPRPGCLGYILEVSTRLNSDYYEFKFRLKHTMSAY